MFMWGRVSMRGYITSFGWEDANVGMKGKARSLGVYKDSEASGLPMAVPGLCSVIRLPFQIPEANMSGPMRSAAPIADSNGEMWTCSPTSHKHIWSPQTLFFKDQDIECIPIARGVSDIVLRQQSKTASVFTHHVVKGNNNSQQAPDKGVLYSYERASVKHGKGRCGNPARTAWP
jgi:hypothetical protein